MEGPGTQFLITSIRTKVLGSAAAAQVYFKNEEPLRDSLPGRVEQDFGKCELA